MAGVGDSGNLPANIECPEDTPKVFAHVGLTAVELSGDLLDPVTLVEQVQDLHLLRLQTGLKPPAPAHTGVCIAVSLGGGGTRA